VERLWLWCAVFRTAMPHVISLPKLRVLDILEIKRPGHRMPSFDCAENLREFRCPSGLTDSDLAAITRAPNLVEIGAQWSHLSPVGVESILNSPSIESVDLECAGITDELVAQLSSSSRIKLLDLGNNPLSGRGLEAISQMSQLQRLDIWQTVTTANELESLASLESLEYLSLGGENEKGHIFSGDEIVPVLELIPSLRSVWLDGVSLSDAQLEELKSRYENFRS
tara:strand:- start:158 stop:832 length:675 start_codon:yes stop_codon:yes gene_type:complete